LQQELVLSTEVKTKLKLKAHEYKAAKGGFVFFLIAGYCIALLLLNL
jgi:hypothetical protein